MEMNLKARKSSFGEEVIEIVFEGTFSFGDRFSLWGEYNEKGELVNCSSGTSCRNPQYYIEVSEVFKRMLNIQKDIIIQLFEKAKKIDAKYDNKHSELENKYNIGQIFDEKIKLEEELEELKRKLNRLRNKDNITECNENISKLQKEIFRLGTIRSKFHKEEDKLFSLKYSEMSDLKL